MSTMDESVYNQQSQSAPVIHQASETHQQSSPTPAISQQSPATFPEFDLGLVVPSFLPTNDPIVSHNKSMAFICTTFAPRYPPINNQLGTSSNLRNQVTMQGRHTQSYGGNCLKGNANGTRVIEYSGNSIANQSKVIQCCNCKGDGHVARQCTQSKRAQNSTWFKEKMLLAQIQEAWVALSEEQLAFLADSGERVDSGTDAYT
ncbi:reverse transcriptase domain-containing protein [Tanacetum coccineum]